MKARLFTLSGFLVSIALLALLVQGGAQPGGLANAAPPATTTADAQNVEFVGHIGGGAYAVAVQGDYAYVGQGPRLTILDISNPASPTGVGKTLPLPGIVVDVYVAGGYAHVADLGGGLRVVDVSTPSDPMEVGFYDTPGRSHGVAVAGSYAYVADGWNGLRVVDVSTPTNPTEVGFYDMPGEAWGVAVAGGYAYVTDGWNSLRVVDVSTPSDPTEVGFCDTLGKTYGVAVAGGYAYVADAWIGLRVVDVSNPANPTEVGFYDTPSYAESVAVVGGYAYVTDNWFGLRVVDISTPANPTEVGFCDTPGGAFGVAVAGGYAYVADSNALRVVDVSTPANPTEVGFYDTPGSAYGVAVVGGYAYVAYYGVGLRVVDISTPSDPTEVGFCDTPVYAQGVAVAGSYAYVADGWYGDLRVVDVSTPSDPTEVGFYDTPGRSYGVAVAGGYAYVADGYSGLRVVDVSTPSDPTEVSFYDTPGEAYGVAVAGGYAYVADYESGLRVVDVSTPSNPTEVGFCDTPGDAQGVAVAGSYAYVADSVADGWRGDLRVVDISTPANPTEVGFYDTPGPAYGVAVVGGYAYVAAAGGGLSILRYTGAGPPQPFTISPIYPTAHTALSTVMQGGTAYRHFHLTNSGGSPIPNATVTLSTGGTAISDAGGYFTATVQADGLGGLGSHAVSVQSVTYGGQTYTTNGEPSFSVEVAERRYTHSWECGAVRKASGGVSSGLVAYLTGEVNGGMALTLEESDPDATDDDRVTMAENYTGEAGAGFGVDFSPSIKGGLVKVEGPGDHLVGELLLRTEAGVSTTFSDPYQKAAREAQGLMLLAGIADSITGFPGQPLLADILARANVTLPYDEVTVGAGVHERADLGIDGLQLSFLIGKNDAELNAIDLNLLAATGDLTVVTGHKYYNTLVSEFYVLDLYWQASSLGTEIGPIKNLIGNYVGEYVATVQEEVFYDQNTGQVSRIELSIIGEGNDLTFTDIDQSRVTTRYIIQGDQIDQAILNAAHNLSGLIRGVASSESADLEVGNDPIIAEINGLLGNVGFAEYEITTEDGTQLNLVPEIGLEGILKIDLGAGLELKRARQLVYQQGVLLNGQPYPAASYQADGYVSRAGKDWLQLSANAVGGLWDLVKDAFNWVWQQMTSGVGWVIGTVSETVGGVIQGGAQITAPPGTQLYATRFGAQGVTIQQTDSITVTAVGWVPTGTVGTSSLVLSPAVVAASGQDFVVGGIYEFSPYTLTVSPAATLVITYTDEAAAEVDESHIGMFRWNPDGNNWQPMVAQADLANNTFTANITQLGTFALGYDDTPPQISILAPADGSTISNKLPLINALVADTGVGIDSATVEMRLNGQVVAADYITGTGQLVYLPATPLANGTHTVTVSAADVVGNSASVSTTFQVEDTYRIYLPIILKSY